MNEVEGTVSLQAVTFIPTHLICGHRGRSSLQVLAADYPQALRACEIYHKLGYQHLAILPLYAGEPEHWRPWRAVRLAGLVRDGR